MEKSENTAKKKYSLVRRIGKPLEQEPVSWQAFEQLLRSKKVDEAIIIIMESGDSIQSGIAKMLILAHAIFKPDGVDCIEDLLLVDHEEKDILLPCIIFLQPELEYAVTKAMLYGSRKSIIQCIITNDDKFHVNECELTGPHEFFGHELN